MMIVFEDREVVFTCKETGELALSIPIKIILKKLNKKASKVKLLTPYFSKEDVEREYFSKLTGVNVSAWIAMNFEQTKSGKRSLNVYAKILNDLSKLLEEYSLVQLNGAISRCNTPQRCTIAYLKAILRNQNKGPKKIQNEDLSYQKSIEHAIEQIM